MYITLAKKELKHYFNSPIGYVLLLSFAILATWFFATPLFIRNLTDIIPFFGSLPFLIIFFAPAISMRLFSEEKKSGTIEILETLPISDFEITIGKFIAASIFVIITLITTLLFPILLIVFGQPDFGVIFSSYFGAFLYFSAALSIGIFISSLTKNQIVAFIISLLLVLLFTFIGDIASFMPGFLSNFVQGLSFQSHYEPFLRGVIDIRDILYFLSIIIFSLVLTMDSLSFRNR